MAVKRPYSFRLDDDLIRDLHRCAWLDRTSVSEVMRTMLREKCRQRLGEPSQPPADGDPPLPDKQ